MTLDEIEHELRSVTAVLRTVLDTLVDIRVKLAEIKAQQECPEVEPEKQA